ncbi:hypothetical protein TVAG_350970 [Trichomonas vaginalis G3]|uniref:Uncharacterized protein n=1 Tax=Trichomonas vaginalis (strain ATCC PRA-98 / G3) TaxID=412133 RepID=A2FUM3_TRIV3|nr:hypothetical protein TVAGG3_0123460 [Trichomonas vaginalis G3]EAX91403.1 hypothetical protein TVAG_350970 [Trichomonas vaginalis G3]KAI5545619.1 hypothetical protein TVAGG3_0123460 [Trichomonas vaginalis G3]|eukprot:XP_001304333.1 hypothetical protein [Trichomonas vaginalis G3]
MGQDESKPAGKPQPGSPLKQEAPNVPVPQYIAQEYDGIPPLEPLILGQGQFSNDFHLRASTLPDAHKMAMDYLHKISSRINDNERQIAVCVKKQLEEYINLPNLLTKRQDELNNRLSKILTLFRQLDEEVKSTTDALKSSISFADKLAAQIDPTLPTFSDYRNQ